MNEIRKRETMLTIKDIQAAVLKIAPQYPISKIYLFGSYAEGNANAKSDVDVLVEFHDRPVTLLDFCGFQQELSDMLNVEVDIIKYPLSERTKEDIIINKVVYLYG